MVILATGSTTGGSWFRLKELARYLGGEGVPCHVITYAAHDLVELDRLPNVTVHEVSAPPGRRGTPFLAFGVWRAAGRIDTRGMDRVWLGSFAGNAGLGFLPLRMFGGPSVRLFSFLRGAEIIRLRIRRSGSRAVGLGTWLRAGARAVASRVMLRASDLLLVQTSAGLAQLEAQFGAALPARRRILPNNVNAAWIEARRNDALAQTLSRNPATFTLLFVGRLELRVKGLDTLLAAAGELRDAAVRVRIIGEGPDRDALYGRIRELDLGDRVTVEGWRDNPLKAMAGADLLIVPSRAEPLPNVILEAFAMGLPVLGADVDGIRVLLEEPELLFPAGDHERLAGMIRRCVDDPGHLERLRELCRRRKARFRFDWGERFREILQEPHDEEPAGGP